ncbi:hypothetical protein U1Q18_007562, partial [Sarracenia purpurea var. burkii]
FAKTRDGVAHHPEASASKAQNQRVREKESSRGRRDEEGKSRPPPPPHTGIISGVVAGLRRRRKREKQGVNTKQGSGATEKEKGGEESSVSAHHRLTSDVVHVEDGRESNDKNQRGREHRKQNHLYHASDCDFGFDWFDSFDSLVLRDILENRPDMMLRSE